MAQNAFERIVRLVRNEGVRKGKVVAESAAGRHLFDVYAWEDDLFLIQRGLSLGGGRPVRRHPVMLIRKSDLRIGKKGWLFCAAMGPCLRRFSRVCSERIFAGYRAPSVRRRCGGEW